MPNSTGRLTPRNQALWFWPQRARLLPAEAQVDHTLFVCDGVRAAKGTSYEGLYSEGAFIPNGAGTLVSPPDPAPEVYVPRCGAFRLPDYRREQWLQAALLEVVNPHTYRQVVEQLGRGVIDQLCTLFDALEPLAVHGVTENKADQPTVTFDVDRDCRPGLHLDSWENSSLEERRHTKTRLCVNLGPGKRQYLFVPLTLEQILRSLPESLHDECSEHSLRLVQKFFQYHPDTPVVRLTVPPGCGYFADTDNMIHDGSTLGERLGNLNLTIRGRFGRLECATPNPTVT